MNKNSAQNSQVRSFLGELKRLTKLWPYAKKDWKLILIAAIAIPFVSVCQAFLPLALSKIIDSGVVQHNLDDIIKGTTLFFTLTIGAYLARSIQSILSTIAVFRMVKRLRNVLIEHILKLKCSYHDQTLSGTLVTRATSDFDNLNESLNQGVLTSVVDIAVLIGCVSGLLMLDWRLAVVALILMPIMSGVINKFSKLLKKTMLEARAKISALNAFTQEALYGTATIKSLTAERDVQDRFDELNIDYRNAQMKSVFLDAFMFSVIDGFAAISIGLILFIAVRQFEFASFLTAGVLVAFVTYMQQLFEPLKMLGNKVAMLQSAFTSIDRIFGILDHKEFISGSQILSTIKGKIVFDKVYFDYDLGPKEKPHQILHNLSFEVNPGTSLAIVGPTGSGKSTIIKLITKLYDNYNGSIQIDDQEVVELSEQSLRDRITLVPQDIVLFDGTVRFNIGLDHPNTTQKMIENAARQVGAISFIEKLPDGFDTVIKEHGSELSYGQKQLIAFARALARNPSVIIMDEATSSIDHKSEQLIQSAIQSILKERTVIVIAHRLSTIRKCQKILVIDQGAIIEQGSHQQLMDNQDFYYQLSRSGVTLDA
jgi:ATP-binding cassette, subfamily B, multidrug efflux pump